MINFEVVIGIENHIELKTNTKMFSKGKVSYAATPNSQVNPVDMGYPGMMPSINKCGVKLALWACKGLNLEIDPILRFDRKNYYYADLPKGFQITQQFFPIGRDGFLEIENEDGQTMRVDIERLHMEEDTAKQIHEDNRTLLDYNRCGIGLVEVVTRPVMHSAFQACRYVEKLRETVMFLNISDAKMAEGSLRCDINISLRPYGFPEFGSKVELKNLNSINNVRLAIEYEIKRQSEILLKGGIVDQETRRFDEKTKQTVLMRKKSDATDYKYFAEPNILPIKLEQDWVMKMLNLMPRLPKEIRHIYAHDYNLKQNEIDVLMQDLALVNFFEKTASYCDKYEIICNYLLGDVQAYLNQKGIGIEQCALTPRHLAEMINLISDNIISTKQAKTVLKAILTDDVDPNEIVEKLGLKQISDPEQIKVLLQPVFDQNQDMLKQYSDRPERVVKFFMGELMKLTKGQAAPTIGQNVVETMIDAILKK